MTQESSSRSADTGAIARPCDVETEQMVLASMLNDHQAMKQAQDLLNPIYFGQDVHARIAGACLELAGRGEIATPVTVKQLLEQRSELESIGGIAYLVDQI